MASALRGIIVRGIRGRAAQILNGSKLSGSSHGGLANDQFISSQSLIIKGCKFISQGRHTDELVISNQGHADELVISDQILVAKLRGSSLRSDGSQADPTEDQIISSASSVIKFVDKLIKSDPDSDNVYGAFYMIYTDSRFKTYPEAAKLKVMSRVLDVIQNYPQVDSTQVYQMRIYIRSMSIDNSKDDLTKDQVISRVLDVIHSYPLVRHYKVTKKTHFHKDLGLDKKGCRDIILALEVEFKICLPRDIDSCILAIDYIYDNRMERMCLEELRNQFEYVPESEIDSFWEKTN